MPVTAEEVFQDTVRALPSVERLRLAALILADLTQPPVAMVDVSDEWSEQDQSDVTMFALRYADSLYPEEEPLA